MALGQKIQIALIMLILGTAAYFFFANSQKSFDMSVNSWTLYRKHAVDASKPISPANAEDPKKLELVNGFGCVDGKLEISEYPNDSAHHPTLKFDPEKRGGPRSYLYYQDPLSPIASVKDPLRHALALATYHQIYATSLKLLGGIGLTADQLAKELDARNKMNAVVTVVNGRVADGTFHPELMDNVMKALATYKANSADPQKDPAKATLARKVLAAATDYIKKIQADKNVAIEKYIDALIPLLTPDQQTKLIAAAKTAEQQSTQPAARTRTTRGRGTAAPARGPATTTPATAPAGRGTRGAVPAPVRAPATTPATTPK